MSKNNKLPRLFWGTDPIINNKYWSKSLSSDFVSHTVMNGFLKINNKEDFDIYCDDVVRESKCPGFLKKKLSPYILTYFALKNYDIFHISFFGLFFKFTRHKRKEAQLYRKYNKKIVVLPYGADAYMYSRIKNESFQHSLLTSYPEPGKYEKRTSDDVYYWSEYADFIPCGFMIDGFPRWDVVVGNFVTVDVDKLKAKNEYSNADGKNDEVNIVHCPNHRGAKGTEFIISAINKLKSEGYKINFYLIEGRKNNEVLDILVNQSDILIEQLIMGYGLNAIEGMAAGNTVISNLEIDNYTRMFRRFSYLNECPIVSATPETIEAVLRILISNPMLRKEIGMASRKFAEKYHSGNFSKYLFNKIYDKIWFNKDVDFSNLFHPLNPNSYNKSISIVEHPLFENKIMHP